MEIQIIGQELMSGRKWRNEKGREKIEGLRLLSNNYQRIMSKKGLLKDVGVDCDGRAFLLLEDYPSERIPRDVSFYGLSSDELKRLQDLIRSRSISVDEITELYA